MTLKGDLSGVFTLVNKVFIAVKKSRNQTFIFFERENISRCACENQDSSNFSDRSLPSSCSLHCNFRQRSQRADKPLLPFLRDALHVHTRGRAENNPGGVPFRDRSRLDPGEHHHDDQGDLRRLEDPGADRTARRS